MCTWSEEEETNDDELVDNFNPYMLAFSLKKKTKVSLKNKQTNKIKPCKMKKI